MGNKTITQKDLDLIRIEAEAIESTDDKYYLMEQLHKYIQAIEAQLKKSEKNNKTDNDRQTIEELQSLHDYAMEIRAYIMGRKIGRKRYGLFVEYPEGYDG
ncbi:hypothetical protein SAMN05216582_10141 [Selenomonas ruminantium]|uniref:Uncharacterized protein n=1 Tax=Selenomonas ruminantium TaxID=971 RepID=A0A1M6QY37_SELRU|nr:hypothetical protein [Selenomonas ruminantium]SHK24998.1 hypothetical protein SAMN05216582_10141 [Selenomonas ruminantium]